MARYLTHEITASEENLPLKTILRNCFELSGTQIKRIRHSEGYLTVNGNPARTVDTAKTGDIIEVRLPDTPNTKELAPFDFPIEVIYEDEDILVVNKPAGLITHPTSGYTENTLANALCFKYGKDFVFRPVGRLDKSTSGVIISAKTSHAQTALIKQMRNGGYHKEYLAISEGIIEKDTDIIDAPISRQDNSILMRCVSAEGLPSKTVYTVLERNDTYTVEAVRIYTGRTHQIRVHMSHIGHPLLGDFLYGKESNLISRTALHCAYISLYHPVTGKKMGFKAPLPGDIKSLVKKAEIKFPYL